MGAGAPGAGSGLLLPPSVYAVVMSLPMVAVFLVAQRRIVAGITSGAVK